MKSISIDIETYSSTNLQKSGVYRYAESDDFEFCCLAILLTAVMSKSLTCVWEKRYPRIFLMH